jgi:hypothetical protein
MNAIIRATAKQIDELLTEYARRPDATVEGLARLREEALRSLRDLKGWMSADDLKDDER